MNHIGKISIDSRLERRDDRIRRADTDCVATMLLR